MNYLCTICARKNSRGVKNKNFKILNGIPLIGHTILQAKKSKIFSNIVVSTDSNKIRNISKKFSVEYCFKRSKKFSSGTISKIPVIQNATKMAEKYFGKKFDIIIDLDVTAPLREIKDIKKAVRKFLKSNSDILFSVCKSKKNPYFNMVEQINKKVMLVKKTSKKISNRQRSPKVYDMNASIYIWKRLALFKKGENLFSKKTSIYLMPQERSVDIDSMYDWRLAKFLIKKK
tara:strand:- start:8967 stop:9659 length:693 start_codon:yes stop_codon:yes gene_type:complete